MVGAEVYDAQAKKALRQQLAACQADLVRVRTCSADKIGALRKELRKAKTQRGRGPGVKDSSNIAVQTIELREAEETARAAECHGDSQ